MSRSASRSDERLRVLVVDADDRVRESLTGLLAIGDQVIVVGSSGLAGPALHLAAECEPDIVIVDPPRAGLSQKIVRRVLECEAQKIVYVSCNPTTLAPNAVQLTEAGYRLTRVRPVDMFPQTPHIECVALFEKA
jgi:DNA-binding NarL/FixJ family response regulator